MSSADDGLVRALLERQGRTYAAAAGISLRDTPAPLFQLLVPALLLSARIRASVAVASARALFDAGFRDAHRMADAIWQQRVDALGEGGYRRYDERTATRLGEPAEWVLDRYRGDLRRLRERGDAKRLLREVPGIGPTGADIFLREVQGLWPEYAPHFDVKARSGAERLDCPRRGTLSLPWCHSETCPAWQRPWCGSPWTRGPERRSGTRYERPRPPFPGGPPGGLPPRGARRARDQRLSGPSMSRAITTRCTWLVPSTIWSTLASRM